MLRLRSGARESGLGLEGHRISGPQSALCRWGPGSPLNQLPLPSHKMRKAVFWEERECWTRERPARTRTAPAPPVWKLSSKGVGSPAHSPVPGPLMALFCVVWNRSSRHWGGEYGGVDGGYAGDVAPVSPDPNKAIHSTGIFGRGAIAEIPDMGRPQ